MGIVKVDLLGLGMMAVLEDSLQIHSRRLRRRNRPRPTAAGRSTVYRTLQKADTVGMFQIESRAQMAFLPRMHPTSFYDIVVQVGIIRPGPIVGKMVHPYLKRRQGREAPDSLHPSLEPVLARTLGVPLFQEQLLRMAMIAAGFTGGEAEELRRAFGFKRSEKRMKEIEIKLRAGMNKQGIAPDVQEKIVQSIVSFALYGFPESHAASFALIAYASAYLKCHYLAAFTAAILNNQPMGFYSAATLVKDAQRHGLKVKPIDVLASAAKCIIEPLPPSKNPSVPTVVLPHVVIPSRRPDEGRSPERAERVEGALFSEAKDLSSTSNGILFSEPKELSSESSKRQFAMRLGLNFVNGLRAEIAAEIIAQRNIRPFASIDDFKRRIPALQKSELTALAEIGALNSIAGQRGHRRSALWQVERAARPAGPLLDSLDEDQSSEETFSTSTPANPCHPERSDLTSRPGSSSAVEGSAFSFPSGHGFSRANKTGAQRPPSRGAFSAKISPSPADTPADSPLSPMTPEERLVADFRGTGLTVGIHPMTYHRATLTRQGVRSAIELRHLPDGTNLRIAGTVIARQRPGTAKGFVFLSIEDETGIANAIITPQLFTQNRIAVVHERFLLIDGVLQNQDNVISVKAYRIRPLTLTRAAAPSHDFH